MQTVDRVVSELFGRGELPEQIRWTPGKAPAGTVDQVATWDERVRGYVFRGPAGPAVVPAFVARERWGDLFGPVLKPAGAAGG